MAILNCMEIKDRIKEVRLAVGSTQVKFAKRIAISTTYISDIESGIRVLNERVIRLVIAEFNVNEQWLRTGRGTMFNEDVSANVSEAMGMFKSLNPQLQLRALKMLTVLTEINDDIKQGNYKPWS